MEHNMKKSFNDFVEIVATLRSPDGCAWDREQTLYSLRDSFIEEVYEAISAIDRRDIPNICEELGDVLLHVVLHAQIASEEKLFTIDDVVNSISEKIVRRHPHVFGEEKTSDVSEVLKRWDEIKKAERGQTSVRYLDKANRGAPTLPKATKLQEAAAKVGFDWKNPKDILNKIDEEVIELKSAIACDDNECIKEEIGDLLFVITNLARHHGFTADEALRSTNEKFVKRFNYIEDKLKANGRTLQEATLDEMEKLWLEAKK
jgi:tetrapyrrole methylase family protein/MazG family protein